MLPTHSGSLRLFRFSGIQVYLHWSWFLVAVYQVTARSGAYESPAWKVAEYLALFAIVTMHEFGHALACRQVGGTAHDIVLWPLGGVAYVAPPQRAGATLWSIAAGPLVNVALLPVFWGALVLAVRQDAPPDVLVFLSAVQGINQLLLVFNLLPVYPLDGGQILRSLLWFFVGRRRSLLTAATLGLIVVVLGGLYLGYVGWRAMEAGRSAGSIIWPAILVFFLGSQCWSALKEAKMLARLEALPRHRDFSCPTCRLAPPGGPIYGCTRCGGAFDPFSTGGVCPHCQEIKPAIPCAHCGAAHPVSAWRKTPPGRAIIDV